MCPFRVLVILISMLIALLATMAALAKDPAEEEAEVHSQAAAAPKSVWARFVDFWTGRYLYRESKRMLPACFFSSEEQEQEQEQTVEGDCAATAAAAADNDDHRTAGEDGRVQAAELVEPSAPELDADADAAFARAYKRHPGVAGLSEAGIAAVIS